jgi:hypothetical protein
MENVLGFDYHELLASYINEYGALKRMIAELRVEVLESGEQAQNQFEQLHYERRLIVLKLERDFGIELNELAEAKEHMKPLNDEFMEYLR